MKVSLKTGISYHFTGGKKIQASPTKQDLACVSCEFSSKFTTNIPGLFICESTPPPPLPPPPSSLRITQLRRDNKSRGTSLEADQSQAQESSEFPDRVKTDCLILMQVCKFKLVLGKF